MSDALDSPLVPPALRDALRFSPQNAPLLLHVAEIVLRNGGFNEAEALFKRDPGLFEAHRERQAWLRELQRVYRIRLGYALDAARALLSEEGDQDFLARVPHAEYAGVAGAGHMVAGDRNEIFNQAILGFLERHR